MLNKKFNPYVSFINDKKSNKDWCGEHTHTKKLATKSEIISFLSYFNNVNDILHYNCPEHLEEYFHDSARDSHKSLQIPDYVPPSDIHISTMTTTALLSLEHNLNLQSLFYSLPCYCPSNSSPNDIEMTILNIEPQVKGKRKRKKVATTKLENESLSCKIKRFTKAFMSSEWIIKSEKSYCPLKRLYDTFCQYYSDRFNRITGKVSDNPIPYDEWRNIFITTFNNGE